MNLGITKTDFEAAVPAAREPKGKVFEALQDAIGCMTANIALQILGDPGVKAVEEGDDDLSTVLRDNTKRLICIRAFLSEMRGLDLVLTATGFGVVSTNDTAPASKMRVDALEGELRRKERLARKHLIRTLFDIPGWSDTPQRYDNVETLFWAFTMLETYAGISHPKPEDWDNNVPIMYGADSLLRKHIGDSFMDELLSQTTSHSLTEANSIVAVYCQKFIGAEIAQNLRLKSETYMRLINQLENNLDKYPTYANSEAYRLNHFKPYENHAEDSAFHFVG